MVINQFIKDSLNQGLPYDLTFWRDSTGVEVDLIQTQGIQMHGYEIKSGSTYNPDYFKGLKKWGQLAGVSAEQLAVIYAGDTELSTSEGRVMPFPKTF